MKPRRIYYLQYTNPAAYPPLQHSSRILADAGWDVLFLGTQALGSDALEFPQHERVRVLRMRFCAAGKRQKLHYLSYALWTFWWTLRLRPRWIYASDPLSAPAAWLATLLPGVSVVYHEHDSPPAEDATRFMRVVRAFRKRVADKADIVVLPNAVRAAVFAKDTELNRNKVECVWNCPVGEDAAAKPSNDDTEDVWILFHGSIVPDRLPMTILDAMAQLPANVKLRLIGYETAGSRGYVERFVKQVDALGLSARFHYLGPLEQRTDLLSWGRRSHIGLAFMPMKSGDLNMKHMTGASNKPFDYLASGIPLLVSDLSDWNTMFVKNGVALSCNPEDPEAIASAIRWYLNNPKDRKAMGEAGRHRIQSEWNYETQFASVRAMLEA